jgi:hypothetical protein
MLSSAIHGNISVCSLMVGEDRCGVGGRTFEELAAVDLPGGDFEGDNMALETEDNQYSSGI